MFVVCPKCAAKYQIPPEITLKEGQKVQCSACRHIFDFHPQKEKIENESSVLGIQVPENPVLTQIKTVVHEEKIVQTRELPDVFQPLKSMPERSSYTWLWVAICLGLFFVFMAIVWFYRDMMVTDYFGQMVRPVRSLPRVVQSQRISQNRTFPHPLKENKSSVVTDVPFLFEEDDLPNKGTTDKASSCDDFRFHSIRFRNEPTGMLIEGMIHNNTSLSKSMPDSVYATAYNSLGQVLFQKEIFLSNEVLLPYGQKAFFGTYSPAPDGVQWIEVTCKK